MNAGKMDGIKMPLVSVIIPLYNADKYIALTIESVLLQTYKNWELIVIDDCSTDNSCEIVKNFEKKDSRIRLIHLEENFGGPARPRNIGVENAQGEYVAFLDADDLWTVDKLEKQLAFMQINELKFSSTDLKTIDSDNNNIPKPGYKINNYLIKRAKKNSIEFLIRENFIATSSVILKKSIFCPFNESEDMVAVEDFCLWLKLFDNSAVSYKYLDEKLLCYRMSESSISERAIVYKQEVKALMCILKFILETGKFKYINSFSLRVIKRLYLRNMLKTVIK